MPEKKQNVTDLPKKLNTPKIRKIVNYTFAGAVGLLLVNEGVKRFNRKSENETADSA